MATSSSIDISKFQNLEFWNRLCPNLNISEQTPLDEFTDNTLQEKLRDDDWQQCKSLIQEDGYFAYDSWFKPASIQRLCDCLEKLNQAGIPPIFSFVYDEFWQMLTGLEPLFDDLLEGEYQFLPAIWVWHVKHENQTAFAPHRDQVRDAAVDDEDHLDYLTIWVPLTDLNHLSSCICVLPASADPDYGMDTKSVVVEDLQDIRTLQGKRGSVFCWATGLIHWGTRQSPMGQPRMSVGFYVQNPEAECHYPPPIDFKKPIPFKQRLAVIGQQIIFYSREAGPEQIEMANALVRLGDEEPTTANL